MRPEGRCATQRATVASGRCVAGGEGRVRPARRSMSAVPGRGAAGEAGARSRFTSSARCAERGREGGGSGGFWLNGGASAPRLVAAVVLGDGVSIALTLQILRFTWTHRAGVRLSTLTKPHDASAEELARRLGRRPLGAAPPGTCAFASWQRAAG
jgi:hypothetical protein